MPTRGNIEKIGVRIEAKPESAARQNGELADRARSSGRSLRRPSSARTAEVASGTATWTCWAIVGSRCARAPIVAPICRYRAPLERATSDGVAVGCVPATAARSPRLSRKAASSARRRSASSAPAAATVGCGAVLSSTTHACVSADACAAIAGGNAASTASMRFATDQVLRGSRSITSSSIPTVHGVAAAASFQRAQGGSFAIRAAVTHRARSENRSRGGQRRGLRAERLVLQHAAAAHGHGGRPAGSRATPPAGPRTARRRSPGRRGSGAAKRRFSGCSRRIESTSADANSDRGSPSVA